jgi:hypothetical protein
MRKFIILFTLILSAGFVQGQNWINTSLNNRVSVRFALKPEIQEFDNVTLYQIPDSEYIVNISFADATVTTNFASNEDSLKNLYNRIIHNKVKAAGNVRIVSERSINLNEYVGLEVDYTGLFEGVSDVLVTDWDSFSRRKPFYIRHF